MAGLGKLPSLPPPLPKDPPPFPDLYGKRREFNRVQLLEREISFLEEEVKFAESLNPSSNSCQEVVDFATTNPDPFIPMTKAHKSSSLWKWVCGTSCMKFSWPCCIGCSNSLESRNCCNCNGCRSQSSSSAIIDGKCSKHENYCCCCCKIWCKIWSDYSSNNSTRCVSECHHPFTNCNFKGGCVAFYSKCLMVDPCYCCKRYSCYHCSICY